jgi:hypothetical protein
MKGRIERNIPRAHGVAQVARSLRVVLFFIAELLYFDQGRKLPLAFSSSGGTSKEQRPYDRPYNLYESRLLANVLRTYGNTKFCDH